MRIKHEMTLMPLHNGTSKARTLLTGKQRTVNCSACSGVLPTTLHARDYSHALGSLPAETRLQ